MKFKSFIKMSLFFTLIASLFLFVSCGTGGGGGGDIEPPQYSKSLVSNVSVGSNVHSFTTEQLDDLLVEILPNDDITFRSSIVVDAIVAGDIIVGATSIIAEYGFLRNVDQVTDNGDGTISFSTSQAALDEVFNSVDAETTTTLLPSQVDVQNSKFAKGVTLKSASGSQRKSDVIVGAERGVGIDFDLGIETGGVTVDGQISVTFGVNFDFNVDVFTLQSAKIEATASVKGTPSITFDNIVTSKIPMGSISFTPITVMAGPVPVVIVPRIPIYIVVSSGGALTISADIDYRAMLGVEYTRETGEWRKIDSEPSYEFDFSVAAGVNVHAGLKANADLLLYGVSGPSAGLEVYREISAEIASRFSGDGISLTYKQGIKGTIEGKFKVLSREFVVSAGIFDLYEYIGGSVTEPGENETGTITNQTMTGRVLDATTGNPIEGVTVIQGYSCKPLDPWTIAISPRTSTDGSYVEILYMSNQSITLSYQKDGYEPLVVDHNNGPNLRTVYLMPVNSGGVGTMGGRVLDANNGNILTNYDVKLVSIATGTTLLEENVSTGDSYTFAGIPAGEYEIVATFPDGLYYDGSVYARVLAGQSQTAESINAIPGLGSAVAKIVLSWGQYPYDLDSHLTDTATSGATVHTWYSEMLAQGYANLDLDDTSSYGPETTTIERVIDGGYTFFVHDFSNRGASTSYGLSNSNATVTVIAMNAQGEEVESRFNVPTGIAGTNWTVFSLTSEGIIVPENHVGNQVNYPTSKSSVGAIEFHRYLDSLPDKSSMQNDTE